jgi:CBS domain-containing protein
MPGFTLLQARTSVRFRIERIPFRTDSATLRICPMLFPICRTLSDESQIVTMRMDDVMIRDVETISATATLSEAAAAMQRRAARLLRVGNGGETIGVLTGSDLIESVVARRRDPGRTTVAAAMRRDISFCYQDQTVEGVRRGARRASSFWVVLRRDNTFAGLVPTEDLSQQRPKNIGEKAQL